VQIQFWTKNIDPTADNETLKNLCEMGLLNYNNNDNSSESKFWSCFFDIT